MPRSENTDHARRIASGKATKETQLSPFEQQNNRLFLYQLDPPVLCAPRFAAVIAYRHFLSITDRC